MPIAYFLTQEGAYFAKNEYFNQNSKIAIYKFHFHFLKNR
jgi:hypothetical protein